MMGLMLGIDLCDDYSQICCINPVTQKTEVIRLSEQDDGLIPTVICRKKGENQWVIGEEAYSLALCGTGTTVDKLIRMMLYDGHATIENIRYTGEELTGYFVQCLIDMAKERYREEKIAQLVFTMQDKELSLMDALVRIGERAGVPKEKIHMASHAESYLFYMINQKPDIWINRVSLFDLSENGLHYYEMNVFRGQRPQIVETVHQKLEEHFSLDILDDDSGRKLGDTILASCAERLLDKKVVTSVFLTGKGFLSDWPQKFISVAGRRRRVFSDINLFSQGACFLAADYQKEGKASPFICLCEGRLESRISIPVFQSGKQQTVIMAEMGSNWYETEASADFILDGAREVEFWVQSVREREKKRFILPLNDFPRRPDRASRIRVCITFKGTHCMNVKVTDLGFGELFPGSQAVIEKEFAV